MAPKSCFEGDPDLLPSIQPKVGKKGTELLYRGNPLPQGCAFDDLEVDESLCWQVQGGMYQKICWVINLTVTTQGIVEWSVWAAQWKNICTANFQRAWFTEFVVLDDVLKSNMWYIFVPHIFGLETGSGNVVVMNGMAFIQKDEWLRVAYGLLHARPWRVFWGDISYSDNGVYCLLIL